jgi:hypothetical protein
MRLRLPHHKLKLIRGPIGEVPLMIAAIGPRRTAAGA